MIGVFPRAFWSKEAAAGWAWARPRLALGWWHCAARISCGARGKHLAVLRWVRRAGAGEARRVRRSCARPCLLAGTARARPGFPGLGCFERGFSSRGKSCSGARPVGEPGRRGMRGAIADAERVGLAAGKEGHARDACRSELSRDDATAYWC